MLYAENRQKQKYLNHYVIEKGDDVAVSNMLDIFGIGHKLARRVCSQ